VNHASDQLIEDYAAGAHLPHDRVWALEAHLETCAVCRSRLATVAPMRPLVDQVWAELAPALDRAPVRSRRAARWLATWVTPVMWPWLAMTTVVTAIAAALGSLVGYAPGGVSMVELFAPVLPVLGVAASWARGLDPAYEVAAASARAGLQLILRRTVAVLAVVVPVLLVAGWLTGTGLGLWLLPSLAFATGTLALGGLIGVSRAAYALVAVWALAFVLPTVVAGAPSFVFTTAALPVWAGIFVLTSVVVALRKGAFTRLGSLR
jgi:hypothetical protein